MVAPTFDRLYLWQERTARRWGNPLSSALDRFSRRHTVIGPVLQATTLFVLLGLVFWAMLRFRQPLAAVLFSGIAAVLLLLFNIGYYRWLRRKQQTETVGE